MEYINEEKNLKYCKNIKKEEWIVIKQDFYKEKYEKEKKFKKAKKN